MSAMRTTTAGIVFAAAVLVSSGVRGDPPATTEGFLSYLQRELSEGCRLRRRGTDLPLVSERVQGDRRDDVAGLRQRLSADGEVVAWRSLVARLGGDDPFLLQAMEWAGAEPDPRGLEWALPLPEEYQPATWEISSAGDDVRCDILLYDRRHVPERFAKAYGIDTIPRDRMEVPPGTPLLRVRVFSRAGGADMRAFPRIQTHAQGRWLVVPMGSKPSDLRVLFTVERFRENRVTLLNRQDNRQSTIRFHGRDEVVQFGPQATLALRSETEDGEAGPALALGLDFEEAPEQEGLLIAELRLDELVNGCSGLATVQDARLVDAGVLGGQALYLGRRRAPSEAKIVLPASVRERFVRDAFTLSAWVCLPWGQLDQNDLVFWPYRRGAEGLEKPFTRDWVFMSGLGELMVRVGRHDRHDTFELRGGLYVRDALLLRPPGWSHVALVVAGDTARLYLNGRLQNDTILPRPFTAEALRRGGDITLFDGFWGSVCRLRLHDHALSERRLRELMRTDVPDTLVHYPLKEWRGGETPAIQGGDFPVDAWSWDDRDFKPEITFAAKAASGEIVKDERMGEVLRLSEPGGLKIPGKALRDLALSRVTVSFWWKSEVGTGSLVQTPGHWNRGVNVNYRPGGFQGVVCANWTLPACAVRIESGRWNHLAVSYDNREFRLYHNGELVKRELFVPDINWHHGEGLVVGGNAPVRLSDLRVTGRLPTEAELEAIREARRLLEEGRPVKDVAWRLGYRHANDFSRF